MAHEKIPRAAGELDALDTCLSSSSVAERTDGGRQGDYLGPTLQLAVALVVALVVSWRRRSANVRESPSSEGRARQRAPRRSRRTRSVKPWILLAVLGLFVASILLLGYMGRHLPVVILLAFLGICLVFVVALVVFPWID